jgi:glutamate receptor ionotropic, NMDA 2B
MTGYGIALPKGSKYKEMIDRKILEYAHSGALERSQKFWFSGTCKNVMEDSARGSHGLGIPQSLSVFILLVMGFIIAFVFLSIDNLYHKYIKKRINQVWFYERSFSARRSYENAFVSCFFY